MKLGPLIALITLSLNAFSAPLSMEEEGLRKGQCYSIPDSKNYLSGLKERPLSFATTIREIGKETVEQLKDTDTTKYYFCTVRCKNQEGAVDSLWVKLSDSPSRSADMNAFLCAGVKIENVQIVGSIYGPQPVITPYFAFQTDFPEIHGWLKKTHFSLSGEELQTLEENFVKAINVVAGSYISSGSPALRPAGLILSQMVDGSPEGKELLKSYIAQLIENKWALPSTLGSVNYFVMTMLKAHGRFLEYQ